MIRKIFNLFLFFIFLFFILFSIILFYPYIIYQKTKFFPKIDVSQQIVIIEKPLIEYKSSYYSFDSFYILLNKYTLYIIKFGDTLWKIKNKFKLKDYKKIIRLNKIKNPDLIYKGDVLKIPEK